MIYLTRRMKLYFKDRASWSSSIFRALGTYSYFGLVVQWMTTTIVHCTGRPLLIIILEYSEYLYSSTPSRRYLESSSWYEHMTYL